LVSFDFISFALGDVGRWVRVQLGFAVRASMACIGFFWWVQTGFNSW
jgi:hypothetical protein